MSQLRNLAIPSIIAGLSEPLIGLTDVYFLGQCGQETLAGAGIGASLLSIFVWFLSSLKNAGASKISQLHGAQDHQSVKQLIPPLLFFMLVIGIVAGTLGFWFKETLIESYGASAKVTSEALNYFGIRIFSLPLTLATYQAFAIKKGLQDTYFPMLITLAATGINICLDYILIVPSALSAGYGVEGAAYASVITQTIMLIAALFLLRNSTAAWNLKNLINGFRTITGMGSDFLYVILRILFLNGALYWTNRFAGSANEDAIAAQTVLINIWLFTAYFLDGYANASFALAGKYKGSQDLKSIRALGHKVILINTGIALFFAFTFYLFGTNLTELFDLSLNAQSAINETTLIYAAALFLGGAPFSLDGILLGLGEFKVLAFTLAFSTIVGFIPWYFIELSNNTVMIIWSSMCSWLLLRAIIPYLRFLKIVSSQVYG